MRILLLVILPDGFRLNSGRKKQGSVAENKTNWCVMERNPALPWFYTRFNRGGQLLRTVRLARISGVNPKNEWKKWNCSIYSNITKHLPWKSDVGSWKAQWTRDVRDSLSNSKIYEKQGVSKKSFKKVGASAPYGWILKKVLVNCTISEVAVCGWVLALVRVNHAFSEQLVDLT